MPLILRTPLCLGLLIVTVLGTRCGHAEDLTQPQTDTSENVLGKLYPKDGKFEVDLPAVGTILNQAFVHSTILEASAMYYPTEKWGFGLDFAYLVHNDKSERRCIENFYNDPFGLLAAPCNASGDKGGALTDSNGHPVKGANFGPAYLETRELDWIVTANATWNPIYGKQIAFLSFTSYFDIFTTMGIGAAGSALYPKSTTLRNGTLSRGPLPSDFPGGCPGSPGVCPNNSDVERQIGSNGRPDPTDEVSPVLTFGIGQKFHFMGRYHVKGEIRNYTLVGDNGAEMYLSLLLGLGMRF